MTLTILKERVIQLGGGVKQVTYKVTDSDGSGGNVIVNFLNHIDNVHVQNMVSATWVSATWTEDAETITIGSEGASSDVYKVTVWGR